MISTVVNVPVSATASRTSPGGRAIVASTGSTTHRHATTATATHEEAPPPHVINKPVSVRVGQTWADVRAIVVPLERSTTRRRTRTDASYVVAIPRVASVPYAIKRVASVSANVTSSD